MHKKFKIILAIIGTLMVVGYWHATNKAKQTKLKLTKLLIEHEAELEKAQQELDQQMLQLEATVSPILSTQPTSNAQTQNAGDAGDIKVETAEDYYRQGFNIWVRSKDYQQAEKYYLQALEIDPDYPPALSSYGYIRGAFYQDYDYAYQNLERAMELDPTWAYAPYNMGLLYSIQAVDEQSAALHQKGIDYVQLAVDKFPNHPDHSLFVQHLQEMRRYHQERFE